MGGTKVGSGREVTFRFRDEAFGEIRHSLRAVPGVEVSVEPGLIVFPGGRKEAPRLEARIVSTSPSPVKGRLEVLVPAGWTAAQSPSFALEKRGASQTIELALRPPASPSPYRGEIPITAVLDDGDRSGLAIRLVDYEHIRPRPLPQPSTVSLTVLDLLLPSLTRIGYIRGASDRVPEALIAVGMPGEMLSSRVLEHGDLSRYDAIVVGPRAYETDSSLVAGNSRLLAYVRAGGLLVVQYQQPPFTAGNFAPEKIEITRIDRVTDENAPVRILESSHPIFTTPNRIGDSDWEGWVQERGLYFAHSWAPAYTPLLSMADPGDTEQRGSLLAATIGKGHYVYTGLAFFRQLPAGVPGAYRPFAKLLAWTAKEPCGPGRPRSRRVLNRNSATSAFSHPDPLAPLLSSRAQRGICSRCFETPGRSGQAPRRICSRASNIFPEQIPRRFTPSVRPESSGRVIEESRRAQSAVFQHPQRGFEHGALPFGPVRLAQRMPVAEWNDEGPRRPRVQGNLAQELDRDGRDPLPLELRRDQAHGLVAHRSHRDEKRHVHTVLRQELRRRGRRLGDEPSRRRQRAHEGEMPMVHMPDPAGVPQLAEAINRKREVRVPEHRRVIERLTSVRVHESSGLDVGGDLAEARISAPLHFVEGLLARQDEARARDERDTAGGQRLEKRRPRHRIDPPPSVRLQEEPGLEGELAEIAHKARRITSSRSSGPDASFTGTGKRSAYRLRITATWPTFANTQTS